MLIADIWEHFSHKIAITEDGVMMKTGIIQTKTREIPFNNINLVEVSQGIFGKILNYGNLDLSTGGDQVEIGFKHLHNPQRFKDIVKSKLG
jgi:uncharacterized membrane protein YdbT with pleckstrin-like domain